MEMNKTETTTVTPTTTMMDNINGNDGWRGMGSNGMEWNEMEWTGGDGFKTVEWNEF